MSAPRTSSRRPSAVHPQPCTYSGAQRHADASALTDGAGHLNFKLAGVQRVACADVFHTLLNLRWWALIALAFCAYIVVALIFGLLFFIDPEGLDGTRPDRFEDFFFYSVRTLSTTDTHVTPTPPDDP